MKKPFPIRPRILELARDYSWARFLGDLVAGLTVGVIALPLAMAFGIASGVKPEQGIYTAIFAGFLVSLLGGSRVQIGGPTGAFVVIVYGVIQEYGYANLLICTMMAGVILVIMGLAGMGTLIKFIPYPVTTGFTTGIAVLIALSQVRDLLGLRLDVVPAEFLHKVPALWNSLPTADPATIALGLASVAAIFAWPVFVSKRVPGSIIVMALGTLAAAWFLPGVETIGTRFGGVPAGLPAPQLPAVSWETLKHLVSPATTIAILAAIESLLSAVVADGMTGDRHDANTELVAQGAANLISPLFGGIPATGAIARTVANIENGGRSPVSGMVHALTLAGIIAAAAPLARHVPLVCLGAVLVRVAWSMGEWEEFARLRRMPKSDAAVFLTTFGLTVVFDLTVAVEVGMILAAMLFIKRISETTRITQVTEDNEMEGAQHSIIGKEVPGGVLIYQIDGAFFFGAAEKMEGVLEGLGQAPKVLILRMHRVPAMDATALHSLEMTVDRMRHHGGHVILSAPHTQPYFMMAQAGFLDSLGHENVAAHLDDALARARALVSRPAATAA